MRNGATTADAAATSSAASPGNEDWLRLQGRPFTRRSSQPHRTGSLACGSGARTPPFLRGRFPTPSFARRWCATGPRSLRRSLTGTCTGSPEAGSETARSWRSCMRAHVSLHDTSASNSYRRIGMPTSSSSFLRCPHDPSRSAATRKGSLAQALHADSTQTSPAGSGPSEPTQPWSAAARREAGPLIATLGGFRRLSALGVVSESAATDFVDPRDAPPTPDLLRWRLLCTEAWLQARSL